MKYFVRNHIFNDPKNRLQAAIQMELMEFNHFLIDDPIEFIAMLQLIVEKNIRQHPRCNPKTGEIHHIAGLKKKEELGDLSISFGGKYADGAYFGFVLLKVRNYTEVSIESIQSNLNPYQNDKDNSKEESTDTK